MLKYFLGTSAGKNKNFLVFYREQQWHWKAIPKVFNLHFFSYESPP